MMIFFFFYATPLSVAEARLLGELVDATTAYRHIICVYVCASFLKVLVFCFMSVLASCSA